MESGPAADHPSGGSSVCDQGKEEFPHVGKRVILTVILTLPLPFVLRCHNSQPLFIIWRISFLLCFGMIIRARPFFAAARLSFCVSYGTLLAFAADALLSPVLGVMIVYLNSVYAAGLFGYRCAEHRANIFKEKAAAVAVAVSLTTVETDEEERRMEACCMVFFLAVGSAIRVAWVVVRHPAADENYLQMEEVMIISMSRVLLTLLLASIIFVLQLLHRTILGDEGVDFLYVGFSYRAMAVVVCLLKGLHSPSHLMAMWIFVVVLASTLGYCLRVYRSYMQMRSLQ